MGSAPGEAPQKLKTRQNDQAKRIGMLAIQLCVGLGDQMYGGRPVIEGRVRDGILPRLPMDFLRRCLPIHPLNAPRFSYPDLCQLACSKSP